MRAYICCLLLAMTVQGQPDIHLTNFIFTAEDTIRTYEPADDTGSEEKILQRLEFENKGAWTTWMDRDIPMPWGTGEFEDVFRQRVEDYHDGVCHMWCEFPLAMEIRLSQGHENLTTSNLKEVLTCADTDPEVYIPSEGFSCSNDAQKNINKNRVPEDIGCTYEDCMMNGLGDTCQYCPDVEARYFCLEAERSCQPIAKRTLGHGSVSRTMIKRLGPIGMQDFTSNQKHSALKQEHKQTQKKALLEDKLLEKLLQILKNNHKK